MCLSFELWKCGPNNLLILSLHWFLSIKCGQEDLSRDSAANCVTLDVLPGGLCSVSPSVNDNYISTHPRVVLIKC